MKVSLLLFKINPNFGDSLYKSLIPILFKVVLIVVVISLIKSLIFLTKDKSKIITVIGEVIICSLVIFISRDPMLLMGMGEFVFNFLFDLLKSLKV